MKVLLFFIFLSSAFSSISGQVVEVTVTGITRIEGSIYLGIYNKKEGFTELDATFQSQIFKVMGDSVTDRFELPAGDYAITAFHDINDNGILDKNFLGYPIEIYGFTNDARAIFSAPEYEECLITVRRDISLNISLK